MFRKTDQVENRGKTLKGNFLIFLNLLFKSNNQVSFRKKDKNEIMNEIPEKRYFWPG